MEIHVQTARQRGRLVEEEESRVVKADSRASLSQWAEEIRRRFGQRAQRQRFLFSNGRVLEDPPRSKPAAAKTSLSDLGVEPGEEFLYIVEDERRSTYRCRVN